MPISPLSARSETRSGKLSAWILSLRLRTLPLACCGIVTGSALARASGATWQASVFWLALLTALLLQLLANLANDYGDVTKASDTPTRLGPRRGMQLGLISVAEMKRALWLTALLTLGAGSALIALACASTADLLLFLALGALSIIAALTYTLGRHAYGYHGLGDLSVLVFFGWVAVLGSYYLQARAFDPRILVPASACGLLCVLVLNVNNLRDLDDDRRHGKMTLAVRLGFRRACHYHLLLLAASFALITASASHWHDSHPWTWLFLLALPLFYQGAQAARHNREPVEFRAQLAVALKTGVVALGGFVAGLIFTQ
jgi:1,4-dihydroxy-2-naphthoate octaprenyltransferase